MARSATRTYVRAEQRRAQVLAGARRHFATHGFDGASMLGIAHELDVDRVTVYRLFPDLGAVYGAVLDEVRRQLLDVVARGDELARARRSGAGRAKAVIGTFLAAARARPEVWLILDDQPRDGDAAMALASVRDELADAVLASLTSQARCGST